MRDATHAAGVDVKFLELLVCPLTKSALVFDPERNALISRAARLAYPIKDGIPVLLPSEAAQLDEDELTRERPQRG